MVLINSGDSRLDAVIESWLKYDKNPHTRQEVLDDIEKSKWDKLRKTMMSRQKFGTAGLRGRMAAGYMCMNDVVVLQTAQGLCSYIRKTLDQNRLKNGIVIGFDGRYNSKRWAEYTAKVFVSASIPVHIFSDVCPTPLVSFATILYKAAAGVMVTASHNPKEDNGYKVFWKNGSQVITPHDDEIMDEIYNCLEIPDEHWNIEEIWTQDMVKDCLKEVSTKYMEYIKSSYHEEVLEKNKSANISVVYSAMHGVGYKYILKAFEAANLKEPISVIEQQNIDPEFSTVTFPNPEEKECLKLSKRLAESKGVKLVLVNDPDADRLAVAEFDYVTRSWKVFSGNEMGALLGWWILEQHCAHSDVQGEDKLFILSSIVSSKMLRAIAKGRAQFVETLTGFKWMGNAALLLLQQGCTPIFAFEEAIGYMVNPRIPDKDGVSAAVQVASLASKLYSSESSLLKMLQELYVKYGFHVSYNSYFIVDDQAVLSRIFSKIRNYHGPSEYPKKVGSMDLKLVHDFTTGVKIPEQSHAEGRRLSVLGTGLETNVSGEMILLECANGLSVTVRTSGTEPKLKFYTELVCTAPTQSEQEAKKVELEEMVKEFINELIQPEEHGLEWR